MTALSILPLSESECLLELSCLCPATLYWLYGDQAEKFSAL